MKRYIHEAEDIFAMSKIVKKYAISDIVNDIGQYIYFSESNSSHGPRIKFYGGTKETSSTKDAPALAFDENGNCTLILQDWMNKKNCPNAFDDNYLDGITSFISRYKSILLLVWFKHLDEGDALAYFHGQINLEELIDDIDYHLKDILSLTELDQYCLDNHLYVF